MNFTIEELVGFALDEALAMDADTDAANGATMPPDLVAHDKAYHKGHYTGGECKYREQRAAMFGITENDALKDDQMDKLDPENVEGEEKDKADAEITGEEHADSTFQYAREGKFTRIYGDNAVKLSGPLGLTLTHRGGKPMIAFNTADFDMYNAKAERAGLKLVESRPVSSNSKPSDEQKAAAYEKLASDYETSAKKAPNDFVKNLLKAATKKAREKADKLGDGGAIKKMLDFARSLGYEFDPAAMKGLLKKVGAKDGGKESGSKNNSAVRAELEKKIKDVESDIENMKSAMPELSPDAAEDIKKEIAAYEAYRDELKDALAGKGVIKTIKDTEKAIAKAVSEGDQEKAKKIAKEAKKKALAERENGENDGAKCALDYAEDISPGKTSVLSSSEFKTEIDHMSSEDRIVAFSDIHGAEDDLDSIQLPDADTVLVAGDFAHKGRTSEGAKRDMPAAVKRGTKWFYDRFTKFCQKHSSKKFVLIAGNDDHFLGDPSADNLQWPSNAVYLKDSETEVNGMRVYGTPWCEKRKGQFVTHSYGGKYAKQPFELDDADAKAYYDKIPEGLDILIVHQPPKAEGYDGDLTPNGIHVGSESLTEAIKRAKPKLVLCGHMHDGDRRPYKIGDTVVMNVAFVGKDNTKQSYSPHEIGIERGSGAGDCGFFVDGEDRHKLGK